MIPSEFLLFVTPDNPVGAVAAETKSSHSPFVPCVYRSICAANWSPISPEVHYPPLSKSAISFKEEKALSSNHPRIHSSLSKPRLKIARAEWLTGGPAHSCVKHDDGNGWVVMVKKEAGLNYGPRLLLRKTRWPLTADWLRWIDSAPLRVVAHTGDGPDLSSI